MSLILLSFAIALEDSIPNLVSFCFDQDLNIVDPFPQLNYEVADIFILS